MGDISMNELKFIYCTYEGPVDAQGLPHGKGTMIYVADKSEDADARDLKYEGEFVHGVRHGEGYLCRDSYFPNSKTQYEWYSEGDYDGCGRLIHPVHAPGSYERYLRGWCIYWEGTWENDMPVKPKRDYKDQYPNENDIARARATALELVREKIKHAGNTSIRLIHEKTDRDLTGHSKFGGKPDLPQGVEYPMIVITNEEGETYEDPMFFVCQIRCEELAPHDPMNLLPHSGMIYVFAEIDYFLGHLESECAGMGRWEQKYFHVMYYDAQACVHLDTHTVYVERDGQQELYGLPEEQVTFKEGADPYEDGIRLLGMPYIDEVREEMPEYINFLQLDEVDEWQLNFFDCGTLNFLIRPKDLKELQFNNIECYLHSF